MKTQDRAQVAITIPAGANHHVANPGATRRPPNRPPRLAPATCDAAAASGESARVPTACA